MSKVFASHFAGIENAENRVEDGKMTSKDYIIVAFALRRAIGVPDGAVHIGKYRLDVIDNFADILQDRCPSFDRDKFVLAATRRLERGSDGGWKNE